jgi:hypothetical protein
MFQRGSNRREREREREREKEREKDYPPPVNWVYYNNVYTSLSETGIYFYVYITLNYNIFQTARK